MKELKKITNGMANGVEAIDENFTTLAENEKTNSKVYTTTWNSNGINIVLTRIGSLVTGVWGGSQSNVAQGFTYTTLVPIGYRPLTGAKPTVMQSAPSNFNIETSGSVRYWGIPSTSGNLSGNFAYFTNDPFPES